MRKSQSPHLTTNPAKIFLFALQNQDALEDCRHQKGFYDPIVPIEMFEAVGEKFWPIHFSKVKSLLADKGKIMVQIISIGYGGFDCYRTRGDAIRTFFQVASGSKTLMPGSRKSTPWNLIKNSSTCGIFT